jgi:ABC-2 type transport system ATP-binding protein
MIKSWRKWQCLILCLLSAGISELMYSFLHDADLGYLPCLFGFPLDESVDVIMLIIYMFPWIAFYMVCGYNLEKEFGKHPCYVLPRWNSYKRAYRHLLRLVFGVAAQWAVTWGITAGIFYIILGSEWSLRFLGELSLATGLLMITALIFGWIHALAVFAVNNLQIAYTASVLVQISSIVAGTGSLSVCRYAFPNWAMLSRSTLISEHGFSITFALAVDMAVLTILFLTIYLKSVIKRRKNMRNLESYAGKEYVSAVHLSKNFHGQEVLKDVCFTLSKGTVTGLVGPNGSGKTVIMKMLCGLLSPSAGQVFVDGKQIGKDIDFPESLGIIIENPGFINYMDGFENLKGLARLKNIVGDNQIKDAMRRLGLDPEDKKRVGKYSLGMKQRLGIAQAIMEDPDFIILDEPMNGLDKSGIRLVHDLILELKTNNKCVLLASHNMYDIRMLCDVVYEIDQSRVVLWDDNVSESREGTGGE